MSPKKARLSKSKTSPGPSSNKKKKATASGADTASESAAPAASLNQPSQSTDSAAAAANPSETQQETPGTKSPGAESTTPAAKAPGSNATQSPPPAHANSPLFHLPPYPPMHHAPPPYHPMMPWRGPPIAPGVPFQAPPGPPPPHVTMPQAWGNGKDNPRKRPAADAASLFPPAGPNLNFPAASWNDMLFELLKYRAKEGDCNVPKTVVPLSDWVNHQREVYRVKIGRTNNDTMTNARIDVLESIGFIWDLDKFEWDEKFKELQEYKSTHGHCNVPKREQGQLGSWVDRQRHEYAKKRFGKNEPAIQERIDKLDGICFLWDVEQYEWDKSFKELEEYKEANGHCNVPVLQEPLGIWVNEQRRLYGDKLPEENNDTVQERINKLNLIGFVWSIDDFEWDMHYQRLKEFQEKHGHCNVDEGPLMVWVSKMCNYYANRDSDKHNVMTEERIKALDTIGFSWNSGNKAWDNKFNELIQFKKINGHCNATQRNSSLGEWVRWQREKKRHSEMIAASGGNLNTKFRVAPLTAEQRRRLDAIGFQWRLKPPSVGWEARFEQLREFKAEFGHCNVPQAHAANPPLGKWVSKQRQEYSLKLRGKKSQLTDERIARLEQEGLSWLGPNGKRKSLPVSVGENANEC